MRIFIQQSKNLLIVVFLFSLILLFTPLTGEEAGFTFADKIIHFCLFFLLSFFALLYFARPYYKIFLGVLLYILAAETIQEFLIPGRGFQIGDLLAGFLGLLFCYLLFRFDKNQKLEIRN